jgi:hypothetical protein
MYATPSLSTWGQRCARLGLASLVAAILLSWSGWNPPGQTLATMGWLGGALIILGFLSWRKAWLQAGTALSLRAQVLIFMRPLVGCAVLIGGAMLFGAALSGDRVSMLNLALAGAFGVIGFSLVHDSHRMYSAGDTAQRQ